MIAAALAAGTMIWTALAVVAIVGDGDDDVNRTGVVIVTATLAALNAAALGQAIAT